MMDAGRHPNIRLMANSEVCEVRGKTGSFKVRVLQRARFVDVDACTACGACTEVCPVAVPHEFDLGLKHRKAVYQPFAQAVPAAYIRSAADCLGINPLACARCADVCEAACIDFDDSDKQVELDIGAIIVATGIDYFDPREASEFGYSRFANVVTSLELERLLSSVGPSRGELIRFTDGRNPKKIAFIQCVGSRNMKQDIPYCSRICCMNAIKDALIIREHFPEGRIDIFYIDIRAFGKGFEELYRRSLADESISFIRAKPSKVVEDPDSHDPVVMFENPQTGHIDRRAYDLVVLSSALVPSDGSVELARILGIETDKDRFFKQKDSCAYPLDSTKPGVYLCGCAVSPKDITDSIAEASGAAARATRHLEGYRLEAAPEEIPQIDPFGEPRIGVFICHCGVNIAAVVDTSALKASATTLPNVVHAEEVMFACSASSQKELQQRISDKKLNRVVVAACTPRTHEPIFRQTIAKVGLNPYLFEMANIRDQCSWVHHDDPGGATQKAADLVRMAVAKARLLEPLSFKQMQVARDVLIIGGGIAGMQTAIDLKDRGFTVHLVEKSDRLGGRVAELGTLYPSLRPGRQLVEQKRRELEGEGVDIRKCTEVVDIAGFVGNFDVTLRRLNEKPAHDNTLRVGAVVMAIGADLYRPMGEFGYGTLSNVVTNVEAEKMMAVSVRARVRKPAGTRTARAHDELPNPTTAHESGTSVDLKNIRSVVFIQCVGSRQENCNDGRATNPGCSRYCCQAAIKQAIAFRQRGIDATILYRDVRVYSRGAEEMYREARARGVLFARYDPSHKPEVSGNGRAEAVRVRDHSLDMEVEIPADLVVLSVGMIPYEAESKVLQALLKVPRGADRFFMERHPKLGPVETSTEGVFLCGSMQGPKDIADSIAQASAVAAKVAALLSRETIQLDPVTSHVNPILCRGCGDCEKVCEFHAIEMTAGQADLPLATVNEALCKGCGTCAAICPTGAIDLRHFKDDQIGGMLEALLLTASER
ncbi:MAG: CoB--CoM heterodisulfide reductase iron-sulfur subunit A family protein [Acidobacteria bacterium]|nr:CoB--CoM heterodisulfide reductase iron-sulfur subunit A family protein [Acidobacteriota bacterium]